MKLIGPKQLRKKELLVNLNIKDKIYIDEVIRFILNKKFP